MWTVFAVYLLPSLLVLAWAELRARRREAALAAAASAVRHATAAATVGVRAGEPVARIPKPAPEPAADRLSALLARLNAYFAPSDAAAPARPALSLATDDRVTAHWHGLILGSEYATLYARNGTVAARQAGVDVRTARGAAVSAWAPYARALDGAQIVRLDRLIRTLHVLNASVTPWSGPTVPLWLPVHPLHVRAVPDAYGTAFADILHRCGRTPSDVVLEFADADRLPAARLAAAVAGFRARGYGIAFLLRGEDPDWLARALALAPDAVRFGPAHLATAARSRDEKRRLAARIDRAQTAGARAWLAGATQPELADLALALGADGWLGADTGTEALQTLPLPTAAGSAEHTSV